MGSNAKKQTTMAKLNRERRLKERRELKAEKKEARRLAAAYPASGQNADLALLLGLHLDALGSHESARRIMQSAACGVVSPTMRTGGW